MLEISISMELAAEHPQFMAACAEEGYTVDVFDRTPTGVSGEERVRREERGEEFRVGGPGAAVL